MLEPAYSDKDGNMSGEKTREDKPADTKTALLTADHLGKYTPTEIERGFGVPVARQREGVHIVHVGEKLAKDIETALDEFVRQQLQDKLTNLVANTERCMKIQESNPADAMIAKTSRINCHHDIRHIAEEIFRYVTEEHLLNRHQQTGAVLVRDLLMAATNALEDRRFAGAAARVTEARKALSRVWESEETEKETTLNELVRSRLHNRFTDLVESLERCERIHEEIHDGALMATTSRFNVYQDVHHMTEEISRYITVDKMFTSKQLAAATQARDSLVRITAAMAAMQIADAVAWGRKARQKYSEIWDNEGE